MAETLESIETLPASRAEFGSIILETGLPPGDVCTLTAAVYSLKRQYPEMQVDVLTSYPELWDYNPDLTSLKRSEARVIKAEYPLIHKSNQVPCTYLHGYTAHLAQELGLPLVLHTNRPMLYLGQDEKPEKEVMQPYWLISAGIKSDFTCKAWPTEYYQEVIDKLKDRLTFVQIGSSSDSQPELHSCTNLLGKTSLRELVLLAHDCLGGLGPSTLLQHLCAAWQRPYVCLLGGREGMPWQASYQTQHTLHTIGQLDCCAAGGCWKSKVVHESDKSLCRYPVLNMSRPVAKCMAMIKPSEVIAIIERALELPPPQSHTARATTRRRRRRAIL